MDSSDEYDSKSICSDDYKLLETDLNSTPSHMSKIVSDFGLASLCGSYYPCLILRNSEIIKNGKVVYFFHNQCETEVPQQNIIGNLEYLKDCEVSYSISGSGGEYKGVVCSTDSNESNKRPLHFLIATEKEFFWVPLPYIFLTAQQAKVFFQ